MFRCSCCLICFFIWILARCRFRLWSLAFRPTRDWATLLDRWASRASFLRLDLLGVYRRGGTFVHGSRDVDHDVGLLLYKIVSFLTEIHLETYLQCTRSAALYNDTGSGQVQSEKIVPLKILPLTGGIYVQTLTYHR
jgi:hypothetical protein